MTNSKTVIFVDDDESQRRRYRSYFTAGSHFVSVGEAADGRAGIAEWRRCRPDVVVMDLNMPVMPGEEAIQHIHSIDEYACVVALTESDERERVAGALDAGVAGYLLKKESMSEVDRALDDALSGLMPLSARIRLRVVELWRNREVGEAGTLAGLLTPRQEDIVLCLSEGLSNRGIAQKLCIAEGTVKQHLKRLATRLDADSRLQILLKAVKLGAIDLLAVPPQY
ncbi:MAG: response regulator transcription factor [Propionibacteriaceae bacterium]|jgi:DNA-binding NarL/FixJ family response regulator|nr:response regulator transcription factor [Propionibacteriaceae bacterium]